MRAVLAIIVFIAVSVAGWAQAAPQPAPEKNTPPPRSDSQPVATFRLAEIMEKTDRPDEAREFYTAYLKIMPHGPKAEDAHKALEKLQAAQTK